MAIPSMVAGAGDVRRLMQQVDWPKTALGDPAGWSEALRLLAGVMLDASQPMFIMWGPQRLFLYNDAFIPIAGSKHPKSFGRPSREVWTEAWDELGEVVERVFAGEPVSMTGFKLGLDRRGRVEDAYFDVSHTPVRAPDGSVRGLFGVCTETTERVLRDRLSLQRVERERDRIFEMSRDLFAVATFEGNLTSINPAWSRYLGRSDDELLSHPFARIIHPDDLAATADVVATLMRGEAVHQFFVRLLRADGSAISFAWSATPGGNGTFYTVGRDITDDQRREEALRQSQKMEAVGQLTGGLAHDFNNLLQAVHGNLDLIRRKPTDPERVARLAQNGLLAAERGTRLTAQLLAFSRSQRLELRPTAIVPLIADMHDMLQRSLGPRVQVSIGPGGDDFAVMADPTQLEVAILNIAINARDAMPEGGDLTISARARALSGDPELPAGEYIEIRVSDTGTGMSEGVAARAFDPFFTTKGVGKGNGLGLSQVYGMARQAGGSVRIDSTSSQGTSIVLLLKREPRLVAPSDRHADAGEVRIARTARSVLVIDDDPDVRQFLADSLGVMGFNVALAEDGASGLALLDKISPDLLLLDFAMPGMTGAEVANRVRADRPAIPIIFASGYSDTAAIEAAVGTSAVLLRKPFSFEQLEAALNAALPSA